LLLSGQIADPSDWLMQGWKATGQQMRYSQMICMTNRYDKEHGYDMFYSLIVKEPKQVGKILSRTVSERDRIFILGTRKMMILE
jgi:hypothetical protein